MKFLKNHPFAVSAHFKRCTVLTFAVPKEQLLSFIPTCLELDTFQDKWAFIAVAMVQTKELRPKGTPKILGNDFFLIGYRIFVRYNTSYGKRLRGLYIIKSETNKKKMEFFGNIFTHYNYTTTDINIKESNGIRSFSSNKSNFLFKVNTKDNEVELPDDSPFSKWKEARRFAGPLPFTFTYDTADNSVLIIEGVRSNWKPKTIDITEYNFGFLNGLDLEKIVLANAFEINDIPYYWKKGKKDIWN
ncbi:DUF2071 domain-containing protein [Portibacter marinus]|uniref:DUF2071 domain-containing protein n=1 Tax=Portibacter marinus TaxID=2898660 RepID=UPI001F38C2F5|nr:DUF2071 domain-containing protein [Portibacter marinus]